MICSSEINGNKFSGGREQLVFWYWTGIVVSLEINKGQINAWQLINQWECISKQESAACFVILNMDGSCIGAIQGANHCFEVNKSIGKNFHALQFIV